MHESKSSSTQIILKAPGKFITPILSVIYSGYQSISTKASALTGNFLDDHLKLNASQRIQANILLSRFSRVGIVLLIAIILLVPVIQFIYPRLTETRAAVGITRPDGDVTKTFASCAGTNCTTNHYTAVDETSLDPADYVTTGSGMNAALAEEEYTMTSVAGANDEVTQVVVKFQAHYFALGSTADTVSVRIYIDGGYQAAQTVAMTATSTLHAVTFNGSWTGDDDLQVELVRNVVGSGNPNNQDDDVRIYQVFAEVVYTPSVGYEQSAYRWFANTDSANVGSPLAAQDTSITIPATGQDIRLRTALHASLADLGQSGQDFRLQVAEKGVGTCAVPSGNSPSTYVDVGSFNTAWDALGGADWTAQYGGMHVVFNNKLWQMGGFSGGQNDNVWSSSDGETWELVTSAPGWVGRNHGSAMVHDNKIWVMGGFDGTNYLNDVWSSPDGETWTQVTASAAWADRSHASVNSYDNKLWLTGGFNGTAVASQVYSSTDGATWSLVTTSPGWTARNSHQMTTFNNKMWVIGGNDINGALNDVWSSTNGSAWTRETQFASWSARHSFGLVQYDNKMWVMGGTNGTSNNNSVYYSSDGITWNLHTSNAGWPARHDFGFGVLNNQVFIYGGFNSSNPYDDVWRASQTPITWKNNAIPADKSALTDNANDPSHSSHTNINQAYTESNSFTNTQAIIGNGQDGLWDFSLTDSGGLPGSRMCFRIVKNNGSALNTYSVYPELKRAETTFNQTGYRWYNNANSLTPGSALASENTAASLEPSSLARLRLGVTIDEDALGVDFRQFSLQYATNTSGPWADVGDAWCNDTIGITCTSDWTSRSKISIDNSASAENLSDFPILVRLSAANIDYGKIQNSGEDIRFVDAAAPNTVIPHEIEKWDEAGESLIWVKVPQLEAGSSSDYIYMYYNNPLASNGQDTANVWDSSYVLVQHLEESAACATTFSDSTSLGNNGSCLNTPTLTEDGKVGRGRVFDGLYTVNSDAITLGDNANLELTTFTVSGWTKRTSSCGWDKCTMFSKGESGWTGYSVGQRGIGGAYKPHISIRDQTDEIYGTTTLNTDTWYHLSGSIDGTTMKIFLNGQQENSKTQTATPTFTTSPAMIGNANDNQDLNFIGSLDEIRVSNVVRSADWIEAEYLTSSSNSFAIVKNEESVSSFWKFYNNASVADGTSLSSTLISTSDVAQSYAEGNPTAYNPYALAVGQAGEWDFVLDSSSATEGVYYFRLIRATGEQLDSYTTYPELTLEEGGSSPSSPAMNQIMRGGKWFLDGVKQSFSFIRSQE